MEPWLMWIVAGFALVIAELISGTFYLLVLGVGAFVGALMAYLGANMVVQALVGGGVAIAGAWFVHHWHSARNQADAGRANFLDRGQPVVLEGWSNESAGIARVKYRGASWDARLNPTADRPAAGTTLYIEAQEGNLLVIALPPPK